MTTDAAKETDASEAVTCGRYRDNGFRDCVFKNVSGCSTAFQYSRKPRITIEKIPDFPKGIPTYKKSLKHRPVYLMILHYIG